MRNTLPFLTFVTIHSFFLPKKKTNKNIHILTVYCVKWISPWVDLCKYLIVSWNANYLGAVTSFVKLKKYTENHENGPNANIAVNNVCLIETERLFIFFITCADFHNHQMLLYHSESCGCIPTLRLIVDIPVKIEFCFKISRFCFEIHFSSSKLFRMTFFSHHFIKNGRIDLTNFYFSDGTSKIKQKKLNKSINTEK